MSDIKSEIANMNFPLKTDADYKKTSTDMGRTITSQMKQYSSTYQETSKFLRLLYLAMSIVLISQVVPIIYIWFTKKEFKLETFIATGITLTIFILLVMAMRVFITKPERIRTFSWLSSVGIAPAYSHDIFHPSLELNSVAKNLRESNNHVHIKLASDIGIYGYSAILTIENIAGNKIYHVLAGRIQKGKYVRSGGSYYADGRSTSLLDLVHSLSLKPGKYKTRLLIFETVYPGSASPTEVLAGFEVTASDAEASVVDIDLSSKAKQYSFKSHDDSPTNIQYTEGLDDAKGIELLLSSPRFQKRFSKAKIMFSFGNINGVLTYEKVERALHPARVLFKFIRLKLKRKKNIYKSIHLDLN